MRGKTHPPYDPEFRKHAVHLVVTRGLSKQQVADELGCSCESIRTWVRQYEIDEGLRAGPSTEELERSRRLRREDKALREERDILQKAQHLLGSEDVTMRYAFIERERANHPVARMLRVLQVSRSGYYAWRHRVPSERARANEALLERIAIIHEESNGTYGWRRIHAQLQAEGWTVNRKRVARLMRLAGLRGTHRGPARP